jgi:hypothetical protein
MVMRMKKQFCDRCGKATDIMFDRSERRPVFVEDHKCDPKDVLVRKFKKQQLYEEHPWMEERDQAMKRMRKQRGGPYSI